MEINIVRMTTEALHGRVPVSVITVHCIIPMLMNTALPHVCHVARLCRLIDVRTPDGKWHRCRLLLFGVLADLEEAADLLALKHANSKHPDIRRVIPKDRLADLGEVFPKRTEEEHKQVTDRCTHVACNAPRQA